MKRVALDIARCVDHVFAWPKQKGIILMIKWFRRVVHHDMARQVERTTKDAVNLAVKRALKEEVLRQTRARR